MGYAMRVQDDTVCYGVKEYVVDTPSDIDSIPLRGVAAGSVVFCITTAEVYMLQTDCQTWTKI